MKKLYMVWILLGIFFLLDSYYVIKVQADTFFESVELTDEDRYDPKYYEPLINKAASYRARSTNTLLSSLEEALIDGWENHEASIDVLEYQIATTDITTYYFQILNNHPEFFYVDSGLSFSYRTTDGFVLSVKPKYTMKEDEIQQAVDEMERVASEATALVTDDMEDYEKALVIHDWLAVYCAYDYDNYLKGSIPSESYTAYGALINKTAVCNGYAEAYRYIMQSKLGIPCYMTSSNAMNHAWNIIQINGKYYHVDVTWDDPVWDSIGRVKHDYFLLSDEGITKAEHHDWNSVLEAGDDLYENALWRNSRSSIIHYNKTWYYVDENKRQLFKTGDILEGSTENLFSFDKWKKSESSYWVGAYSYLQIYHNKLIFNGPKKIYSMPFETETVTELFTPKELSENNPYDNIYGFKIDGSTIYYSIQSTPALDESQSSYIKLCGFPGEQLQGKVIIDGELRYGSTLTAKVTLTGGLSGEISYYWYQNGKRMNEESVQTYTLTKQDIGKQISVKAIHDDYVGELTTETGIIQKAIPIPPDDTFQLSGVIGNTLSTISLTDGYEWKEPDFVMSETGLIIYPLTYCPDSSLYETIGLTTSVQVICEPHAWNDGVITKNPTCIEVGTKMYTCTICKETYTEEIEKTLDHQNTEVRNLKEATCVETGYTGDCYCVDCGSLIETGKLVPTTGHTWDEGKEIKAPTYMETGIKLYTCIICKGTKTEEIAVIEDSKTDEENQQGTTEKDTVQPGTAGTTEKDTAQQPETVGTPKETTDLPEMVEESGKNISLKCGKMTYKVTKDSTKNGTVELIKTTSTSKTLIIPATITVNGVSYKVTSVAAKALKNNKKITKVVIGSNIKTIGKEAFSGCTKLKTITIKSAKITTIGKNAIKNIYKKASIKCPDKKLRSYEKLLTSKTGFRKTMKIKK